MVDDPASGPRLRETNWVWLAERTDGVACELGAENEPGDSRLPGLFSEVQRRPALRGLVDALGDESVDAVVIHSLARNEAAALDEDFLGECRRVLRPGGYVVFCADYAWWYRRIVARLLTRARRDHESSRVRLPRDIRSAERRLTRAGFKSVRCYLGDGSATALEAIVPASGGPLLEMGRIKGRLTARRVIRLLLTRIGLGPFFYRTLLVFGYR